MAEADQSEKYRVVESNTFYEAMVKISENASHAVFVVDCDNRLVGSITDGDIRRALISGSPDLNRPISEAMHRNVRFLDQSASEPDQRRFIRKLGIEQLPLIDDEGHLVRVVLASTLFAARRRNTPVLLMAGGLGTRLGDLTRNRPKPLVMLGDKPIMEHILLKFHGEGYRRFYISINHMGQMVRDYFGDGSRFGVSIHYLLESKPLGTAGALSLLESQDFESIIVSNCDVICDIEYSDMLDFHDTQSNDITMGVVTKKFSIPFGVVDTVSAKVVGFREKPDYEVSVNAGIYVLQRELVSDVPHDVRFDMPQLLELSVKKDRRCAAFVLHGEWIDVGRPDDLERARQRLVNQDAQPQTPMVMKAVPNAAE